MVKPPAVSAAQLESGEKRQKYIQFAAFHQSAFTIFLTNLAFLYFTVLLTVHYGDVFKAPDTYFTGATAICAVGLVLAGTAVISGWLLLWLVLKKPIVDGSASLKKNISQRLIAQYTFEYAATLSCVIYMIARTMAGSCDHFNEPFAELEVPLCNPHAAANAIPIDELAILMLLPALVVTILRETSAIIVFSIWIINLVSFIVCSIILQSVGGFSMIFIYTLFCPLIFIDLQRQNYDIFMANQKLEEIHQAHEKIAAEEISTEMRHMIANVAHDLKTVS